MDPLKVLKKVVPQQHYFCQFSQILTKVMLLWNDFFLNFQWIHWSEMTLLYLNFEVWGVTDSAFSISGSNCSHTAVLCHFPCFFAQLSPPATMSASAILWYHPWTLCANHDFQCQHLFYQFLNCSIFDWSAMQYIPMDSLHCLGVKPFHWHVFQ